MNAVDPFDYLSAAGLDPSSRSSDQITFRDLDGSTITLKLKGWGLGVEAVKNWLVMNGREVPSDTEVLCHTVTRQARWHIERAERDNATMRLLAQEMANLRAEFDDLKMLRIWDFRHAPPSFQTLAPNGGEDVKWVAFMPSGATYPSWFDYNDWKTERVDLPNAATLLFVSR